MADTQPAAAQLQEPLLAAGAPCLRIALINNMADAALAITEQRFQRLLQAACPQTQIDFRCVTLPSIPRGEMAEARIARHYITLADMHAAPPDAVIFSGAEPQHNSLRDEVFWAGLTELFDWTRAEGIPSLFSCLAAHAAVLHFAGIERRRLPSKAFGVFTQTCVMNHALLAGMPGQVSVAHSRWNDVRASDLVAHGYHVLTENTQTGVDMFVPADGAPQLFLQGHPEYEETALLGEYKRDLRRYESGQSTYNPRQPARDDWGSSALGGPAYAPIRSAEAPEPPVNSFVGFETVIRNWVQLKKEMAA